MAQLPVIAVLSIGRRIFVTALTFSIVAVAPAQAPPSIQFFMPDGSLPSHELRFTLTSDDGRVDSFYTDSTGSD